MPGAGLEPARLLRTQDFESSASTNSATRAIKKLTFTTLRAVIGEMKLDEILSTRESINNKIRNVLDDTINKWGVKVNRVELLDITPPATVKDAMEKEMKAEAKIVQAQAEAEAINRIADAIKGGKMDPAHYMLAEQYIASLKEISDGKDNKLVYLPYEASTMLSSVSAK